MEQNDDWLRRYFGSIFEGLGGWRVLEGREEEEEEEEEKKVADYAEQKGKKIEKFSPTR